MNSCSVPRVFYSRNPVFLVHLDVGQLIPMDFSACGFNCKSATVRKAICRAQRHIQLCESNNGSSLLIVISVRIRTPRRFIISTKSHRRQVIDHSELIKVRKLIRLSWNLPLRNVPQFVTRHIYILLQSKTLGRLSRNVRRKRETRRCRCGDA